MPKLYTFLKYFCVILWSCFVIAPFLWAISTSFKDFNSVTGGATYIPWLQFEPTLDGWSVLFKPGSQGGINIIGPYFNSIFVTFTASFISIALGTLAATLYLDILLKQALFKITTLLSFLSLKELCLQWFFPFHFFFSSVVWGYLIAWLV